MTTLEYVLAAVIAAVLTIVGLLEAFRYRDPRLHPIFLIEPGDRDAVRLWTVNVGFYNITMAAGLATGLFLVSRGYLTEGRTLVLFVAAAHVFLGAVLLVSERRLWASALGQAVPQPSCSASCSPEHRLPPSSRSTTVAPYPTRTHLGKPRVRAPGAAEADEFLRGVRCGLGVPQDVCMRLPVPVIVIDGHDIELYADEASAVVEIEGFYADDVVVLGADGTVY